jgi:hypothetical protein
LEALPTLAAYQKLWIRASRLGQTELSIFRVFRRKEEEARLSWKLRLEAAAPEVLLDTNALEKKVDALVPRPVQLNNYGFVVIMRAG